MPVLRHNIQRPDGSSPEAQVAIRLAAPAPGDAGYVSLGSGARWTIEGSSDFRAAGTWSVTLTGNADIDPADTRWLVVERVNGLVYSHTVLLPVAGGPYDLEDVVTLAPDDLPAYQSVLRAEGVVVVNHGAVAGTARPSGVAVVWWVGTVQPVNMADGDVWHNPSGASEELLSTMFDAHTILKADVDNTPVALTVTPSTVVGRGPSGNISAISGATLGAIVGSPTVIVRTADSAASNNSTTPILDDVLRLTLGANETWTVRYVLRYVAPGAADIRLVWSAPAGASGGLTADHVPLGGAITQARLTVVDFGANLDVEGVAVTHAILVDAWVSTGATSGSLDFTFAQRTAAAGDTKILAGSRLTAVRA